MTATLALLFVLAGLAPQKPSQGKVLVLVAAEPSSTYKGVRQPIKDLEDSARAVRRYLEKAKWIQLTEKEEEADIRLRILGRRKDSDKGFTLGYSLDAGAYKTEDEFAYEGESVAAGGGPSRDSKDSNDGGSPASVSWDEIARSFSQSLEEFAKSNYDRIVAQRPASRN